MTEPAEQNPIKDVLAIATRLQKAHNCDRNAAVVAGAIIHLEARVAELLDILDPPPSEAALPENDAPAGVDAGAAPEAPSNE